MIKIKVSYENEQELKNFIQLIQKHTKKVKISKNDKGQYKKAYITMKERH
jgi:hypothetical protein